MRHRKHGGKLHRTVAHRDALLRNMSKALILEERIETTVVKAKELQKFVDPLINAAKNDSLSSRRTVLRVLGLHFNELSPKERRRAKNGDVSAYNADRLILNKLFGEIGPKYKERSGGYTRIVKTGFRVGDAASLCIIECV
ncbi:MAG: 50S ribosomal protein L17 [Chlamydiae bacterium RIFCSPHIGHO2_12_FULL_49_11]|nr:MAG: 50S ribosomal protein L17 [Chlamydiae bacterium RIFCSPHIGHO2_12_FULL_49_11]